MKKIKVSFLIPTMLVTILAGYSAPDAQAQADAEAQVEAAIVAGEWVAKAEMVRGVVEVRRAGEAEWAEAKKGDLFYFGDTIRTVARSRADFAHRAGATVQLDENTEFTFDKPGDEDTELTFNNARTEEGIWISLLKIAYGVVHIFSRDPWALSVDTDFVNGNVEGTEFLVRVERDRTLIVVFQGRVVATNDAGTLTLKSGQAAIALEGQAPTLHVLARPRDAVQWALYYPPILDYRADDFPGGDETDWQAFVRKSLEFYWKSDVAGAFSSLEGAPEDIPDPRFFTYRAALLLSVGRVDEAKADIERALDLDPANSHALALQSIIAVVQNEKEVALDLARRAVEMDAASSAARVALSYAQQAQFDLQGALASLQKAVILDPENPLAWARLAELWLSVGNLDRALEAVQEAVALNPDVARTQTVLGFAYLTQLRTQDAKNALEKAIELDQAAPLPRLGLGLAKIRDGELEAGRREIEIAASLDPNRSLIRSYLGKAYFEEKRDKEAMEELVVAKELDPLDPTSWFYDAIRKQTVNRPVEALQDLQRSIELNDNRAIYRSRLQLDQDLAARSAALARTYDEMGFEQLAMVEAWKSLNADPASHSGHRFLADVYSSLPRHEIARVSELLQSQLLQPVNITPVQPHLAASNLFILEGAGPEKLSFNEFNPLFYRDRIALLASGVVGGNDTLGDDIVVSGVEGRVSYSVGQFHFESDGFRENNDLMHDIYNVFAQMNISHKTSVQAEYRYTDTQKGDLPLRFDPDNVLSELRHGEEIHSLRLGFHHAFTPRSDVIASFIYRSGEFDVHVLEGYEILSDDDGYMGEIQHLLRSEHFHVISGVGHYDADREESVTFAPFPADVQDIDVRHTNLYVYSQIKCPKDLTLTIGGSADFFESDIERDQFNPKVGLIWSLFPTTTLRVAAFRVFNRSMLSNQTIEPTHVAGFNQFFHDVEGASLWRYGFGIDQEFSPAVYGGAEVSWKEIESPFTDWEMGGLIREADWEENLGRAYLYLMPHRWLAISAEYQYEWIERGPAPNYGEEGIAKAQTHKVPLGINLFHPSGFSARLKATYFDQEGEFENAMSEIVPGEDQFWVVDASIGYRLPNRWGLITLEARNLFDEEFRFQDTNPGFPRVYPESLFLARLTLAY